MEPNVVRVDEMLKDLIPLFMQNRRKEIAQMEDMYAKQDFEGFARYGHQLKGVSFNYGYQKLGELGVSIEAAGKEKNLPAIRHIIDDITDYLETVEVIFT
jgi:HPt (histidine-containing phosphotransfer) domain-containing protein